MADIRAGPSARAGRERRAPARHPAALARDARHPLGLRLSDRRRRGDRRGGGRDLAGRRRLRHQLRRAAAALRGSRASDVAPRMRGDGRRAVPRVPTGVGHGARRPATSRRPTSMRVLRGRRGVGGRAAGSARRATSSTSRRAAASPAPTRRRVGARARARRRPARHARLGQPLPRGAGRRTRSTTSARRARSASRRTDHGHDPLRLARARLPGVRRPPARHDRRRRRKYGIELPDRQLCCAPLRSPEGAALPRRDGARPPTSPSPTAR